MIFIFLTFLAAFGIEGIGTYVSIIGLSKTFAHDPIILTLAVALDLCKLVVVSLLYKKWYSLSWLMKTYFLPAALVLMLITSYGAAGYLSNSFQSATLPIQQFTITLKANKSERTSLIARKKQIDDGIAGIASNYISKRLEEKRQVKPELDKIRNRLDILTVDILKLEQDIKEAELHVGPISYMASAFDISMEDAVKLIIMMIIFVFDPLAIMLIIAGNFLLEERKKTIIVEVNEPDQRNIADVINSVKEPSDVTTQTDEPDQRNIADVINSVVEDAKELVNEHRNSNTQTDEPKPTVKDYESLKTTYQNDIKSDLPIDGISYLYQGVEESDVATDLDGPDKELVNHYSK